MSFKSIANLLGKDCTTVSKEVRNHISIRKTGCFGRTYNACLLRFDCIKSSLCLAPNCKLKRCKNCHLCNNFCKDFVEDRCPKLLLPPYVCNGCTKRPSCNLKKYIYSASDAHKEYERLLSESRSGFATDQDELRRLDGIISPLLRNGHSVHHICSSFSDIIMHSEKTIYNYIDACLFSVRNIDLVRKVKYKPRKLVSQHFKVEKACRVARSYKDFQAFLLEHPGIPVVQMDSVIGSAAGKVLLSIHFTESEFMLAFLREANTARSVTDIFDELYSRLGPFLFRQLFPVILTDNGSEFSNPSAIEFDEDHNRRTYVFYCNPAAPYQKGALENNHEFIRRVIPKGVSFNQLTQADVSLMMDHINSYGRKKLNDKSPHESLSFFFSNDTLDKLGAHRIARNDIILLPSLLKRK